MPLTTAHPLIIAPLWYGSRRWLDLPALVVGSTIPDVTYFLNLRTVPNIGHSAYGILVEGIPAALCLLLIFRFVMLAPLRALSSGGLGRILPAAYPMFTAQRLLVIILSIVIGACTHIFWDSFTHDGWFFVRQFPVLDQQMGPLPVYKYLQYASGVFGTMGVILWAYFAGHKREKAPERLVNRTIPIAIILVTLAITLFFALGKNNPLTPYIVVVQTTVGSIAGTYLGLLIYSLIDTIRPFQRVPTNP